MINEAKSTLRASAKLLLATGLYSTELNSLILEIKAAYDNVGKWSQTEKAPWHYMWFAMSPATRIEPKGVVLLITPFNFPLYLLLAPFVRVRQSSPTLLLTVACWI